MGISSNESKNGNKFSIICIVVIIILGLLTAIFFIIGLNKSINEAKNKYNEWVYSLSESVNHVSNDVTIKITSVKEVTNLEVLKVSDIEYVIYNDNTTDAWLEVPGTADFIVDLSAAEFIIDNERQYVLVRAPLPKIANIKITYEEVNILYINEGFNYRLGFLSILGNGSIKKGEELAVMQLKEAQNLLEKEFKQSQKYKEPAVKSAKELIEDLIKSFNKDVEITVEVEFFDV